MIHRVEVWTTDPDIAVGPDAGYQTWDTLLRGLNPEEVLRYVDTSLTLAQAQKLARRLADEHLPKGKALQ